MRRCCLILLLTLTPTIALGGCHSQTPLQVAGASHDTLALAQDLEAQLCFGVADAYHITGDKTHCTTDTAKTIGLTDARHKDLTGYLKTAFDLHAAAAAAAKSGTTVDTTNLTAAINKAVAIILQLVQTDAVKQLLANVQTGGK